jgi:hypothetical protein
VFWKKQVKRDKVKQPMETEYNQLIEGRTEQSTRLTNGQKGSALTEGQQVRAIGRWQTKGSAHMHEEDGIQRSTPDGKYGGGGSVHDWQRVKSQFRRS